MVLTFEEEKSLETIKHTYRVTEEAQKHTNRMEELKLLLKIREQIKIDVPTPKTDLEFLADMDSRR